MTTQVYNPTTGTLTEVEYFQPMVALTTTSKIMTAGDLIFHVNGTVILQQLFSECTTANDATATLLRWQLFLDRGGSATITGASASLANVAAGTIVNSGTFTALSTAPLVVANGIAPLTQAALGVRLPPGNLSLLNTGGTTTGTWRHWAMYLPMEPGAGIQPLF
jgi:hypothetical protein